MDNKLQLFNFEGQNVAVKEINGQVYFNAEQAAIGLGISQVKNGKVYVQWKRVNNYLNNVSAHVRKGNNLAEVSKGDYITEPQFYKLAIKANNPVAERFQDWVTSEVLPAIRKHGAYMTDEKAFDVVHNKNGLADLLQQAANQLKQKDIQIEEMKPKALFADAVATSKSDIFIGQLAQFLKQNGYDIGQNRLFKWMREHHYLCSKGARYNQPTQKAMELGLFKVKERIIYIPDGSTRIAITTKVTGKGQQYFINKFLRLGLNQLSLEIESKI